MFPVKTYVSRRAELRAKTGGGLILLPGNQPSANNYPNNAYYFRQDSTFLYYFGLDRPSLAGVIDADTGEEVLFGDDFTVDDIIWTGPQPTLREEGARAGVADCRPLAALADYLAAAIRLGRRIHYLPPYRGETKLQLSALLGIAPALLHDYKSVDLMFAVAEMREVKSAEEVAQMEDAFRPVLAAGEDVLYITLSSGISGTVASGLQAAQALMEEFPQRQVRVLDSMGAGFGIGLLLGRASDDRKAGLNLDQTYASLERDRDNLCEFFTVDDLMFLRRTGRLSGVTATLGTMLQLKPLLRGDETGHITVFNKVRGRKRAVETLGELYRKRVCSPETQRVYISHGDCPEDAEQLARMVQEIAPPKELIVCLHEPLTGAHVGPGMLALFFLGKGR